MPIDDIIAESTAFQEQQEQHREQTTTDTPVGTIQVNIDPLANVEKSDMMFWLSVVQTIALLYIAWKL